MKVLLDILERINSNMDLKDVGFIVDVKDV
jgi:hypothetical protein